MNFIRTNPKVLLLLTLLFVAVRCGMGLRVDSGVAAPTVSGVSTAANSDGSVTVTISGSGFVSGSTVTVNGTSCTNVNVLSATRLTCVLPNGQIQLVNIVITTPSGGSSGGGSSGGGSAYHTIFVMVPAGDGDKGPLATVDADCASAAATGSVTSTLTGHWRAIMSNSSTNAKDRITFVSGASIKNTHGDTLVANAADLWGGTLLNQPKYSADGVTAAAATIWTGTNSNGTKSASNCLDWGSSNSNDVGTVGSSVLTNSGWLVSGTEDCDIINFHGIYCINSNN